MAKIYMVRVLAVVGNSAAQYDAIFGADLNAANNAYDEADACVGGHGREVIRISHDGGNFTVAGKDVCGVQLLIGEQQPKGLVTGFN